MANVEFKLLSQVTVHVADGGPDLLADLRPQHRLLLAVLILAEGRRVTMARLEECLWDGTPPYRNPHGDLNGLASDLRTRLKAAEPGQAERLPRGKDGYLIKVDADEVDALRFRAWAKQAKAQVRRDDGEVIRLGTLALHEWGPTGHELRGSNPLAGLRAGWADDSREQLRSEYRSVLIDVLDAELRRGNHEYLARELPAFAVDGINSVDQEFARIYLLACYRTRRQAEAADFYRRFVLAARRNQTAISRQLTEVADAAQGQSPALNNANKSHVLDGAEMQYREPLLILTDDSPAADSKRPTAQGKMEVAVTGETVNREDDPDHNIDSPEAERLDAETTEPTAASQEKPLGLTQNFGVVFAPDGKFGINY